MVDVLAKESSIKIGDGKWLKSAMSGKKKVKIQQADGKVHDVTLSNYKCVPGLWTHLFSITAAMRAGWKLRSKGLVMTLTKGRVTIKFDRIFETQDGILCGVEIAPAVVDGVATPVLNGDKPIDVNHLHRIFGHASEEALRKTAKFYGWTLKGQFESCEDCIANFLSILPLHCGESLGVNSNVMPISACSHSFCRVLFSPALSHHMNFTLCPFPFNSCKNLIILAGMSSFFLTNIPQQWSDPFHSSMEGLKESLLLYGEW